MFFEPAKADHGLPHNPFKALVAPRPIGWISTVSPGGAPNLAPYSYFNAIADSPPVVVFSSSGVKDSADNAEKTGEFVCNIATYELRHAMNHTSAAVDADVDEFAMAGLTPVASQMVAPPRVGESPAALECRVINILALDGLVDQPCSSVVVFGQVVGIHIDDKFLVDGLLDVEKYQPLARLGYFDYSRVDTVFSITRPT
ncbi:MAG: flavin reductase family protein, partial [Hyphomicrobiales bacterium]